MGAPELAWWTGGQGGGARARGGGGARASVFLTRTKRRKMAVFEGCPVGWRGGTHRSWPGGRGGRPRALIPGEGVRKGLAWQGNWVVIGAGLVDGGSGRRGKGSAGVQGLRFRGGRW